jgi:GNAT superfamily N-acetyltransferase
MEATATTREIEVTTWSLEMTDPRELKPGRQPDGDVRVVRAEIPSPELSRYLYTSVGGDWYWTMRIDWSYQRWQEWLDRPGVETWLLLVRGTPAGYFMLDYEGGASVEIANFGLKPQFLGQGLGGFLLGEAIAEAWKLHERWSDLPRVERVWVHTCSLDGPAALSNYQSRGFRLFKTETAIETMPLVSPGPWPGSRG